MALQVKILQMMPESDKKQGFLDTVLKGLSKDVPQVTCNDMADSFGAGASHGVPESTPSNEPTGPAKVTSEGLN